MGDGDGLRCVRRIGAADPGDATRRGRARAAVVGDYRGDGRVGALPIYAAVGSVVAVSLKESDMWKAIVLGTSAPAMILNAAHGPTTVGLMVLHAQDDPPAAQVCQGA